MALRPEHLEVLQTLYEKGVITKWSLKSLRGQILSMKTHEERETYLRKVIKAVGKYQQRRKSDG